jgi:hypothetical protein
LKGLGRLIVKWESASKQRRWGSGLWFRPVCDQDPIPKFRV